MCGSQREDGLWDGRVEFAPPDGGPILSTGRETTQSDFRGLGYWATGLTQVYLEGALARALRIGGWAATA